MESGIVEEVKNSRVGEQVTLSDGRTKRVLKEDQKGQYVIKGGIKNYVSIHYPTNTFRMTGEWDHNNS